MKSVRKFVVWLLKKQNMQSNIQSEDLCANLSLDEIYDKSRQSAQQMFNLRALSYAFLINQFVFACIIQDLLSQWMGSMAGSSLTFMLILFLLMLPTFKIQNAWNKKGILYSRVMQKKVDEHGIRSVPSLLTILHKMVNAPKTEIDEDVICNLTQLLPQMGREDFENLTEQNRILLYSLVDPETVFCKSLIFNEKNRLRLFEALLLTTSIEALGTMGGENAIEVIQSRLNKTSNPLLREVLLTSLNQCNPSITPVECHPSIIAESEANVQQVTEKSKKSVLNRLKRSKLQTFGYTILLIAIIFCYIFFFINNIKHNYWNRDLFTVPPFMIASILAYLIERKSMLDNEKIQLEIFDHSPMKVSDILTLSPDLLTFTGHHALYEQLVGEALFYDDLKSIPALSKNEIGRLNFIINNFSLSSYVFENDGSSEDLNSLNPYLSRFRYRKSDRRIMKVILSSVGILGNGDTIKNLYRFIRMSKDSELNAIAEKSIEELNDKIRMTHTLLRPTDLPVSSLLKPAQNTEQNGHLLKLPPSSVGLSITDAKATEEIKISQK